MTNKECIEQVNIIADKVLGAFDTHICDMEELDRQVIAAYLFGMINAYAMTIWADARRCWTMAAEMHGGSVGKILR